MWNRAIVGPYLAAVVLVFAAAPAWSQPCDDLNGCTVNDHCEEGDCVGTEIPCEDDGDPCTEEVCDPSGGCHLPKWCPPNPSEQDCTVGVCQPDGSCTVENLPEDTDCGSDECVGRTCQSGVCTGVNEPDGTDCDRDPDDCSVETCQGGACSSQNAPDSDPCDDGEECTTGDVCDSGACVGQNEVDGAPCGWDSQCGQCASGNCDITTLNGEQCDDGRVCTENDECFYGGCLGDFIQCEEDGNACTQEVCDEFGVVGDPGQCASFPEVCEDGNPCTADSCDPATGCENVPLSTAAAPAPVMSTAFLVGLAGVLGIFAAVRLRKQMRMRR